jgi:hypothetical protein
MSSVNIVKTKQSQDKMPKKNKKSDLRCSICRIPQKKAKGMIAGRNVLICGECIAVGVEILYEEGHTIDPHGYEIVEAVKAHADYIRPLEPSAAIAIIETDLRRLVEVVLRSSEGPEWWDKVLPPEAKKQLQERHDEEAKRRNPALVPSGLMAYTHLYQLTDIIKKRWQVFSPALGTMRDFVVLMDKVEDFRNAPAHSRELLPHERALLAGIAGEIRTKVTVYLSQQSPDSKFYPVIELVRDSFGNESVPIDSTDHDIVSTELQLKVGQDVQFECRGWDPQGRELTWTYTSNPLARSKEIVKGNSISFTFRPNDNDVGVGCFVDITMASSGKYHRHGKYDQQVSFHYQVEPPDA